jgi:formate hydrogenlyase transcriptional activator
LSDAIAGAILVPMPDISVKTVPLQGLSSRSQALLQVTESIAQHRDLAELFRDLAARLHDVAHFDYLNLVLHDPERQVMRLHLLEALREKPTQSRVGKEAPVGSTPSGRVFETQVPFVVPDVDLEESFSQLMEALRQEGVRSFCVVPLTTAQRRLGTMGFGKLESHHYDRSEVDFMQQVARQVAVAVDNALNFETVRDYQQQLARERDRLRVLLEVNNALVSTLDLRELFHVIASSLRRVLHHEYTSLALPEPGTNRLRVRALDFSGGQGFIHEEMAVSLEKSPAGHAFSTRLSQRYDRADLESFDSDITRRLIAEGVRAEFCVPLSTLNVASFRDSAFSQEDQDLLTQVGAQVAIAVENALAFREIADLKNKLTEEKLYLEDEIRTEHNFDEIVGESAVLKTLLSQVQTVAPTDSTVLITGETGTGKELIARALHNLSARRDRTFVKINCAAIPTGLLESELFGHEKGAFTGAIAQKLGRFELADKGTLFLDEVADIPLELQPKLLRVLQEQEFERLGSTRTRRVDVRVVAATNRDLARMVENGAFRNDLFYRLNVFPVAVPPLRERREDIANLIRYFAQRYARRTNRHIETVSAETVVALERYHWPGNIRELENLIERAVILSPSPVLHIPLSELKSNPDGRAAGLPTLAEAEKDHILRALEESKWVLGGPKGAAALLGMKRTTLQSRMQKLGITRPR